MYGYAILTLLIALIAVPAAHAGELYIVAWNLKHLEDENSKGCVGRNCKHAAQARQIDEPDA